MALQGGKGHGAVVERVRVVGIEGECCVVALQGFGQAPHLAQQVCTAVQSIAKCGLARDGSVVAGQGLVQPPYAAQ